MQMQSVPAVEGDVEVRESMRVLPSFLQGFLTWLTGKPYKGQKPFWKRTNISHLVTAYLYLLIGVCCASLGLCSEGYGIPMILLGWLLITTAARKLNTMVNHYCVHGDFLPKSSKWHGIQPFIADFNAWVCFTAGFKAYQDEHLNHHNPKNLATAHDPDMVFMAQLGFQAGMSKEALLKHFVKTLVSPTFHLGIFLRARIQRNFTNQRWIYSTLYLIVLSSIGYLTSWSALAICWVIPMIFGYQSAALLQFCTEHQWLKQTDACGTVEHLSQTDRQLRTKRLTVARFCGQKTPNTTEISGFRTIWLWMKWTIAMLFYHLPIRLFVLQGDLCQHDHHHRGKFGMDWANADYTRQAAVENLRPNEEPFREVWGYVNALNLVFDGLSQIPQLEITDSEMDPHALLAM